MKRVNTIAVLDFVGLALCGLSLQCSNNTSPSVTDAGLGGGMSNLGGAGNTGGTSTQGGGTASGGQSNATGGAPTQGGATASGGQPTATGGAMTTGDAGAADPQTNFFVSSDTSATGNLGGLQGADQRCQRLAAAVGLGAKTWVAYLSTENPVTNARDRIGNGPYYNSQGALVAADKAALHARNGDPALFIDEHGNRINGQWAGSPSPLQHDVLTGATVDGMLNTGNTCQDWTGTTGNSFVGHTDGLGPSMNPAPPYNSWNSSHTGQCANTTPGGGAGRIYCFTSS